MEILTPAIGLIFWTTIIFLLLFLALRKFAWPVIIKMLAEREQNIANALQAAEKAREELENLNADNEKLMREARMQCTEMLQNAENIRKELIGKAQNDAKQEYEKIVAEAMKNIENEKQAAIIELKNEVAKLSINIAEKILRQEMNNTQQYNNLIEKSIQDAITDKP